MSSYSYEQVEVTDIDALELQALCKGFSEARYISTIEEDLELVRQGIKTRKPVQYGHKVIIMNDAIYTKLCCDIFDGYMHQKNEKLDATAQDTIELWRAIAGDKKGE